MKTRPESKSSELSSEIDDVRLQMRQEALEFLHLIQVEKQITKSQFQTRAVDLQRQLQNSGNYSQTYEELSYGAKVAWRNSTRCIGQIFWQSLLVRDMRHLSTAEEIFVSLVEHIQLATNGGSIRPMITIFAADRPGVQGIRIWNPLLIRYAGYRQPDGSVLGDSAQVEFTNLLLRMGWKGGAGTAFDLLPLVIQKPGERPQIFELPLGVVMEVALSHPEFPWFEELGLKWHALPAVSDMRLDIGGVSYSAAPFNGWYMSTEIGSRNLGDVNRYNLLPVIAERMGLDLKSKLSLWKDRALLELNLAVLHSFCQQGVSIIDHHFASQQFMLHMEKEKRQGRDVFADWGFIVPPMSSSATPVFQQDFQDISLKPNFFKHQEFWQCRERSDGCPFRH